LNHGEIKLDEIQASPNELSVDSVLKELKGIAVHDCLSPYFNFGEFGEARHALGGAHLLHKLK